MHASLHRRLHDDVVERRQADDFVATDKHAPAVRADTVTLAVEDIQFARGGAVAQVMDVGFLENEVAVVGSGKRADRHVLAGEIEHNLAAEEWLQRGIESGIRHRSCREGKREAAKSFNPQPQARVRALTIPRLRLRVKRLDRERDSAAIILQ